jgi:hypothetical protein
MKIWQSIEILRVYANFVFKRYICCGISQDIYDFCKVTDPALMSILMCLLSFGAVALVIAILVLFFLYRP